MIQYLAFNKESNMYEFSVANGTLKRLDDRCLYFIRAEKAGTYRNYKGDLITVLPNDVLFVRHGVVCNASDLNDTMSYMDELENNRNNTSVGDCCASSPCENLNNISC